MKQVLVHTKAELIAALLGYDGQALEVLLWRRSGFTWFRLPAEWGSVHTHYGRGNREMTADDWRQREFRRVLARVRRIPEREVVS